MLPEVHCALRMNQATNNGDDVMPSTKRSIVSGGRPEDENEGYFAFMLALPGRIIDYVNELTDSDKVGEKVAGYGIKYGPLLLGFIIFAAAATSFVFNPVVLIMAAAGLLLGGIGVGLAWDKIASGEYHHDGKLAGMISGVAGWLGFEQTDDAKSKKFIEAITSLKFYKENPGIGVLVGLGLIGVSPLVFVLGVVGAVSYGSAMLLTGIGASIYYAVTKTDCCGPADNEGDSPRQQQRGLDGLDRDARAEHEHEHDMTDELDAGVAETFALNARALHEQQGGDTDTLRQRREAAAATATQQEQQHGSGRHKRRSSGTP